MPPNFCGRALLSGVLLAFFCPASVAQTTSPDFVSARNSVLRTVLDNNPDLQEAHHQTVAAETRRDQVAIPDPRLTWSTAPLSYFDSDVPIGQRIELAQPFPFPGSLAPTRDRMDALTEAADADTDSLALHHAARAARQVDRIARVDTTRRLLEEHRGLLEELLQSSLARYEAGTAAAQDPLQVEIELAHVAHELVVLDAEKRVAMAELQGLAGGTLPNELPTFSAVPSPSLVGESEAPHPDILSADARMRASEAAVQSARRSALPDLAVMTSYASMWRNPAHRWMAGVSVELPLHWRARRAEVEEARAESAAAVSALTASETWLTANEAVAKARFDEAMHVVALYGDTVVPTARKRVEVVRSTFESTSGSFELLVRTERALRDAEIQSIAARTEAWSRLAELQVARGQMPGFELEGTP